MAKSKRKLGQDEVSDAGTTSGSAPGVDGAGGAAGADQVEPSPTKYNVTLVNIDSVRDGGGNIRRNLGDLKELTSSIREVGILSPLVVEAREGVDGTNECEPSYTVICGHRRLAAAKQAGVVGFIPVLIKTFASDRERVMAMMAENIQRADMDPMDEAAAFYQILQAGATVQTIAAQIHRPEAYIQRRLGLLDLIRLMQALVSARVLPLEQAYRIARLPPKAQVDMLASAMQEEYEINYQAEEEFAKGLVELETKTIHGHNEVSYAELRELVAEFAINHPDEADREFTMPKVLVWGMSLSELKADIQRDQAEPLDRCGWLYPAQCLALVKTDPASERADDKVLHWKDDAGLLQPCPECVGCPNRVGGGDDLFGGTVSEDMCLRPACLEQKSVRFVAMQISALRQREKAKTVNVLYGYRMELNSPMAGLLEADEGVKMVLKGAYSLTPSGRNAKAKLGVMICPDELYGEEFKDLKVGDVIHFYPNEAAAKGKPAKPKTPDEKKQDEEIRQRNIQFSQAKTAIWNLEDIAEQFGAVFEFLGQEDVALTEKEREEAESYKALYDQIKVAEVVLKKIIEGYAARINTGPKQP